MVFRLQDAGQGDEFLFHYTSARGLAGILDSGRFRMSTLSKMNDPRESKDFALGGSGDPIPLADGSMPDIASLYWEATTAVSRELKDDAHVASFTLEGDEISEDGYFARGFARARNWAQYADGHRGAVLVLNRAATIAAVREASGDWFKHGPVKYADESIANSPDRPGMLIELAKYQREGAKVIADYIRDNHARDLFFTKNLDWQSENEYRFIVWNKASADFSIKSAIEGVVLGELFPIEEQNVLSVRLARLEVPSLMVANMLWINGVPGAIAMGGGKFGFKVVRSAEESFGKAYPEIS